MAHHLQSASLCLIIAYYAIHLWTELRHRWRAGARRIRAAQADRRIWVTIAVMGMLFLSGCIQVGPVIFYSLHLAASDA